MNPIDRVTTEMSTAARVMDVDDDGAAMADIAPRSRRRIPFAVLLITGAIGGVAGVVTLKYVAPDWLLPKSASASAAPSQPKAMPDLTSAPAATNPPELRPIPPS